MKIVSQEADIIMNPHPWYQFGLRFQCTGCGDCCTGAPGYVWINKAEIKAMSDFAARSVWKNFKSATFV